MIISAFVAVRAMTLKVKLADLQHTDALYSRVEAALKDEDSTSLQHTMLGRSVMSCEKRHRFPYWQAPFMWNLHRILHTTHYVRANAGMRDAKRSTARVKGINLGGLSCADGGGGFNACIHEVVQSLTCQSCCPIVDKRVRDGMRRSHSFAAVRLNV